MTPTEKDIPLALTPEELHELRNCLLAIQFGLTEIKEQLLATNCNLNAFEDAETALNKATEITRINVGTTN